MKRRLLVLSLLVPLSLQGQQPPARTATPPQASVRFSFDWSQGYPWQKYTLEVHTDGKSHFDGTPQPDATNDNGSHQQDFTMSDANRQKIFELAQRLNFFRGDFDSHLKHIAKTGVKSLQYESPEVKGSTSFNWSQNPDIQELTSLFQAIAMTIDYGNKLAFQYRFDKLGMYKLVKELEELQRRHEVEELGIIAPILRKIADDPNLMNISREGARRLLRNVGEPGGTAAESPAQTR